MNTLSRFEELSPKILAYTQKGFSLEQRFLETKEKIEKSTATLHTLKDQMVLLSKAQSAILSLAESMADNHIERVQELVSFALKTVFFDRDYTFKIVVSDRGSAKQAEFFLIERIDDLFIKSPLKDSVGGGVLSVIGFTLQVFYIQHLGASPTLFLDESFSQLSSQYIEGLMEFIRILCEEQGFRVVLISHDPRIIEYADQKIYIERGAIK